MNATTDWSTSTFKFSYSNMQHEFVDGSSKCKESSLKLIGSDEHYIDRELRSLKLSVETKTIEEVLKENEEVFGPLAEKIDLKVCHTLEVVGRPVKQRAYRVSPKEDVFIKEDMEVNWDFDREENIDEVRKYGIKPQVSIESQFKLGKLVIMKEISSSKLQPKWRGYYEIVAVGPNNSYQLCLNNGKKLPNWVNGRRLQRYCLH